VSEHDFSRAVKPLKKNTSFLPKAYAQRSGAYKTDVFQQPVSQQLLFCWFG
jgi:hypothetical protein